jgi:hypothetical protein
MPVMASLQFKFKCPLCGWSITLPRTSSIGEYVYETYKPRVQSWHWICTAHELICDCSPDRIERTEFEEQPHVEHRAVIWEINHSCSEDGCGAEFHGFIWWDAAESGRETLVGRLSSMELHARCAAGHEITWHPQKIKARMLHF